MSENINIDEDLYSRQIYTIGIDAMKKMAKSSILISGLGGLGVELAKNIILAGVKSVTLHDTENATINDLSSQFFLDESSIGKNRALESYQKLSELNEYVSVSTSIDELSNDLIKQFNCVVITSPIPYSKILEVSKFCHENSIAFILAMTRGVFGLIFNDFGDSFYISEPSFEKPSRFLIESISHDEKGIVTINPKDEHKLSDGDHVIFDQVEGMTELNGKEFPVKDIKAKSFSIGDTSHFHPYENTMSSGYGNQIILPKTMHFKELNEALKNPYFEIADYGALGNDQQIVLAFFSLFKSIEENNTTAENILKNADIINDEYKLSPEGINEDLIREFVRENAIISPLAAILGGIAGQEAIKSVSSKFTPFNMFFAYSDLAALQPINDPSFKTTIKNDRYDSYRIVFGDEQFEAMTNLKYFMVGAGAIGCELLKNWAMMGVSKNGQIYVTDMDQIEKSNLNRQFLFRKGDIGKSKSACAASAVKVMNPDVNIEAQQNCVGKMSESFYNFQFYNSLSGICNALDNAETRSYNDDQAIYFGKPLLESGTLGPMGHFQTIIPHLTLSYNSYKYPTTKSIPECTLHSFPTNINHCTMWALDNFGGIFTLNPSKVNQYITDKGYVKKMMKNDIGGLYESLKIIKKLLVEDKPSNFNDCIKLARIKFEELFYRTIKKLITKFPPGCLNKDGQPFWRGEHRLPSVIEYDPTNESHAAFINSAAILYAKMYNIEIPQDQSKPLAQIAAEITLPEWKPEDDDDFNDDDEKPKKKKKKIPSNIKTIIKNLCNDVSPYRKEENLLNAQEFEKDDSTNGHVDFVAAAANLRAINYRIKTESAMEIKGIAGNIIPAIATTTAAVCGFVSLEMFKVHSVTKKSIDDFRDGFFNLSTCSFQILSPSPAKTKKIIISNPNGKEGEKKEISFTFWDKWIFEGDLTVKEFIEQMKEKIGLNVSTLMVGQIIVYADFMPDMNQFMDRKITDIYTHEAELQLVPDRMLELNMTLKDNEGNEIPENPPVLLKFF